MQCSTDGAVVLTAFLPTIYGMHLHCRLHKLLVVSVGLAQVARCYTSGPEALVAAWLCLAIRSLAN